VNKSKDWVVRCRLKKKNDEQQLPFEVDRKEILLQEPNNGQSGRGNETASRQSADSVLENVAATEHHQMRNECRTYLVLVALVTVANKKLTSGKKAAGVSGEKDEGPVRSKGRECNYWMVTEISMLGGSWFQCYMTASDGFKADERGRMRAGYNNLRTKNQRQ